MKRFRWKKLGALLCVILCIAGCCVLAKGICDEVISYKETTGNYNWVIEIVIPTLITLIGTFLGFLLATAGQVRYDKRKTEKESREVKEAIKRELSANAELTFYTDELYQEFYRLYSFDGIFHSGKSYLIMNEPWYASLIALYKDYREVNYYCKLAIDQIRMKKNVAKLSEELTEKVSSLKERALVLLSEIR